MEVIYPEHDILKYYKYGYSKVTDQVCREIRFGRFSREFGKRVIAFYEKQEPAYMELFCNWLNIDKRSLKFSINRHRNRDFWREVSPDRWENDSKKLLNSFDKCEVSLVYPNCDSLSSVSENQKFITIGKGVDWPKPHSIVDQVETWL